MSYIRTHNFAKTLLAVLLGAPFVMGIFSNARPAMPESPWQSQLPNEQRAQPAPEPEQQTLFGHINLGMPQA